MTIKNVYEFYFNNYNTIAINTEMAGGMKGKYHTYTYKEYKDYISGWEDKEVVEVIFETVYTRYEKGTTQIRPKETPTLYILYK